MEAGEVEGDGHRGSEPGFGKNLSRKSLHGRAGGEEGRRVSRGFTKAFTVVWVSLHGQEACQCHNWSWRVSLPASLCACTSHHVLWHPFDKILKLCFTWAHIHMHNCPIYLKRLLVIVVQGERLFLFCLSLNA